MRTQPNKFEKYSVLDGRYDLVERDGRAYLHKEIQLHPSFHPHAEAIYRLTTAYVKDMRNAGVPVPAIAESSSDGTRMRFLCEYQGRNLVEHFGPNLTRDFFSDEAIVGALIGIVRAAQAAGLHFDPHLKNFVIDNGVVHYVDFSPPWGPTYYDLRLSLADATDRAVLEDYFPCFHPAMLGFHFASDLIKIDPQCLALLPELFARLEAHGAVGGGYDAFLAEGDRIRSRERAREVANIFLL